MKEDNSVENHDAEQRFKGESFCQARHRGELKTVVMGYSQGKSQQISMSLNVAYQPKMELDHVQ